MRIVKGNLPLLPPQLQQYKGFKSLKVSGLGLSEVHAKAVHASACLVSGSRTFGRRNVVLFARGVSIGEPSADAGPLDQGRGHQT